MTSDHTGSPVCVAARLENLAAEHYSRPISLRQIALIQVRVRWTKPVPGGGTGVGVGIRKGDKLKDRFNDAIKAVRASGEYDAIAKKYFAFNVYGD